MPDVLLWLWCLTVAAALVFGIVGFVGLTVFCVSLLWRMLREGVL